MIVEGMHSLEAKVEHLIHPDAVSVGIESKPSLESAPVAEGASLVMVEPGNAPAVAAASVTEAATAEGAGGAAVGEAVDISPTSGTSTTSAPSSAELPNAAATPPAGAATDAAGDVPNVALAVAAPTADPGSASSAAGASTTSPTAASSGEPPLHMKIAQHLESIYTLARDHVAAAPAAAVADTGALKTHVGDILHRISNGMAVSEGELVTKLEALYRML
jgi:hypothetical protein